MYRGVKPLWLRAIGILGVYLAIGAVYTRPLLGQHATHIAGGDGDPLLNAAILWWNATTVPLTERWWNPPYFYLTRDVTAFTEHLLGISPVATPAFWLTGNPVSAYNLSLFVTWPLSAFAAYLLVRRLTGRTDAAFLAGLAYGFSPYRLAEFGHLQMVSSYWMPIALVALHGYLLDRRRRWLVLFGSAWLLQSLANGYLLLFGGVLIGLWLLFFCTTRPTWRAAPAIVAAWILASLPLVLIMLRYRAAHEYYGLRRALDVPVGFSVAASHWLNVSHSVWMWGRVLPETGDNHFPGITAAAIVAISLVATGLVRRATPPARARIRLALAIVLALGVSATIATLFAGPWSVELAGITIRMSDLNRALALTLAAGAALIALSPGARAALSRRSALVFYLAATVAIALFSFGPVIHVDGTIVMDPAPYRVLMWLPGFDNVRVPMRFWMFGILCLAVAAGLAYARLPMTRPRVRVAAFALAAAGLMLDGWITPLPMSAAPPLWDTVEARAGAGRAQPIVELPLGPETDDEATFRSIGHRRPVVNGVSGYDPPHYAPLQAGLNDRDPAMLLALAAFGSYDVVVDAERDPDGSWARYVSALPGVTRVATDGIRTAYRVPGRAVDPPAGGALPIAGVQTVRGSSGPAHDGRHDTVWEDDPQRPDQWIQIDLGAVREVGGVTHGLGEFARDFPRRLVIELSTDGAAWQAVWEGSAAAEAFRAAVASPREAAMHFTFAPRPARFVRLRQTARHKNMWRVAEVRVHAPR